MKTVKILGVKISSTSKEEVLDFVEESIKERKKFFITTPNPEIVVQAQNDRELLFAINTSDVALPDGVGLRTRERIPGRVMMIELLKLANKNKWSVFLLGSTSKVNEESISRIKKEFSNIKIAGSSGPWLDNNAVPISERDVRSQKEALNHINKFKPDLLFVAFGAPKQEKWVAKWLSKLDIGCVMVVGGALDYFSGAAKLPPEVIFRLGLEWLWRLVHEPRRIRRIMNAIIVFPFLVLKGKIWK